MQQSHWDPISPLITVFHPLNNFWYLSMCFSLSDPLHSKIVGHTSKNAKGVITKGPMKHAPEGI